MQKEEIHKLKLELEEAKMQKVEVILSEVVDQVEEQKEQVAEIRH